MNPSILTLTLASVGLSATAQIVLKHGMSAPSTQRALASGGALAAQAVATNPFVWLGLGLYALGAVVWLLVLARVDVSRAYPFVGLGFLLVMALGALLLGESVGPARAAGTVLVLAGVLLVGWGR